MIRAHRLPTLIRKPPASRKVIEQSFGHEGDSLEYWLCSPYHGWRGFERWCRLHVWIQDSETEAEVRFNLFEGQRRLVPDLVSGQWLILLKGRQLGMTWLVVAFCLWKIVYSKYFTVCVINQSVPYAEDFIIKARWIYDRLPGWSQPPITTDNAQKLSFEWGGQFAQIRAMAGDDKAARSFTGHLAIVDEASRVEDLKKSLSAIIPSLERSTKRAASGQVVLLTTSEGSIGDFPDYWEATYGTHGELLDENMVGPNGFKPYFIHWSERPGRDMEWYLKIKAKLDSTSKVAIKREYPNTIEEAFEYAEGRVYALFTRDRNVGDIEIPPYAKRCIAIDWGENKGAYVVLWIAYLRGPPGLLISPSCPNTVKELIGYRLDDKGLPLKGNDHACDALRYAVNYHDFTGMVYVYREVYRTASVAEGWNPMKEIEEIHELSGWRRRLPHESLRRKWRPTRDAETFELVGVADRSMGKIINLFNANEIPLAAHMPMQAPKEGKKAGKRSGEKSEIVQGCSMVAALIDGSIDMDGYYEISREQEAMRILRANMYDRQHSTSRLEERQLTLLARDLLERGRNRTS